jgi:cobyrinic acid a,c-diamide synthase
MHMTRACLIAGTHSGCGKTSVSLGLMRSLARLGLVVQPFKCGPDFIDPGHHAIASGRASHNLDGWMLPPRTNADIFARHAYGADVAVAEGVMGLHDGFSGTCDAGSSAQMARQLDLPVVLVVDARSMARSAAALVGGYVHFDPDVRFAGVIFNRVGSPNHAELLRDAMSALPHVPVLGCLPRNADIALPSRHLGLHMPDDDSGEADVYDRLADWVEGAVNPQELLDAVAPRAIVPPDDPEPEPVRVRMGVARDEAFCFYYEENLRLLRQSGAELVFFSPLHDKNLPDDLDALYLGGGYPELYAFELAQNARMRKQVLAFHQSGRPVYAECGGFMYLMEDIVSEDRGRFTMCGVFPVRARMGERFRALGYREIEIGGDCLLGPAGTVVRGHEFHYSSMEGDPTESERVDALYSVRTRKGPSDAAEGFALGNTLASYIHLHFGSAPVAQAMVEHAACNRENG